MLLSVLTFLTIVSCYSARLLPRGDDDFIELQKQNVDSPSNSFFMKRNLTSLKRKTTLTPNNTLTYTRQPMKWQVERVTRKQYEVINLLWRKTKIFVNVDVSTSSPTLRKHDNFTKRIFDLIRKENPITFTAHPPIVPSIRPSYIEFYYSDESGDQAKKKDCLNSKCLLKNNDNLDTSIINTQNSSFLLFHIRPLPKRTTRNYYSTLKSHYNMSHFFNKSINKPIFNAQKSVPETKKHLISPEHITNKTSLENKRSNCSNKLRKNESTQNISDSAVKQYRSEATTEYDKIKFFELYDKHTRVPFAKKVNILEFDYNEKADAEIKINNVDKILLEHVDQSSHEHNEARHSKKQIVENNKNLSQSCFTTDEYTKPKAYLLNVTTERQNNTSSHVTNGSIVQSETKESKSVYSYINKSVSWSDYPFAAVYVYEPSQVCFYNIFI